MNSLNKFISFNFKNSQSHKSNFSSYNQNFFKKNTNINLSNDTLRLNNVFKSFFNSYELNSLTKSLLYPNFLSLINDDSDKKKLDFPIYKLFNNKFNNNNFYNLKSLNKMNYDSDLHLIDRTEEVTSTFFNDQITYKNLSAFSSNQSVSLPERYVRNFIKTSPTSSHYNYNLNLNNVNEYVNISNNNSSLSSFNFLTFSNNH
jgi:hypothetical protein